MSEQTITGVCQEIAQKPGSEWVEFHIDGGGQWPVRLSTKLQPLIELGRAAGQELATWTYNEVESDKINEKSGKPFVNRYLSKVEVGAAEPPAAESPSLNRLAGDLAPITGAAKDRLIVRQTCIKAAAEMYSGTDDATVPNVLHAASELEKWVVLGILEPFPFQ